MINRLDYFTTTINYTCSAVWIRFSINKVIIEREEERPARSELFVCSGILLHKILNCHDPLTCLSSALSREIKEQTSPALSAK